MATFGDLAAAPVPLDKISEELFLEITGLPADVVGRALGAAGGWDGWHDHAEAWRRTVEPDKGKIWKSAARRRPSPAGGAVFFSARNATQNRQYLYATQPSSAAPQLLSDAMYSPEGFVQVSASRLERP